MTVSVRFRFNAWLSLPLIFVCLLSLFVFLFQLPLESGFDFCEGWARGYQNIETGKMSQDRFCTKLFSGLRLANEINSAADLSTSLSLYHILPNGIF